MFKNKTAEKLARLLAETMNVSNRENYLCGHKENQVYGHCYEAMKNLLTEEFGKDVMENAINSNTWCVSDFDGQIIPAIEWAIKEVEDEKQQAKVQKMIQVIENHGQEVANTDIETKKIYVIKEKGYKSSEDTFEEIDMDWNAIYNWLGY